MVFLQRTSKCDLCDCVSTEPFAKISYKTIADPEDRVFDLCPECFTRIVRAATYGLIRSDLKYEVPAYEDKECTIECGYVEEYH